MLLSSICLEYLLPSFYPEIMSILDVKLCFLAAAAGWILFSHLFCWSVSFGGELRPLMLRDINEQCLFIPVIMVVYFVVVVPFPPSFDMLVWDYLFLCFLRCT